MGRLALLWIAVGWPAWAEAPVFSAGGRAGAHWPLQAQLSVGPLVGATGELTLHPLVSVGLIAEASFHQLTYRNALYPLRRVGAGIFGRYRLDVGRVMPYAEGALFGHQLAAQGFTPAYALTATAAFGIHVPLWKQLYADAQVRYGYVLETGRFPAGATLELGFGWRSGSL